MALAGHELVLRGAATATPVNAIDGINSLSFGPSRDMLEDTDFADTTGARTRFAGLKDGTIQISGDYEPSDTAQALIETQFNNGGPYFVRILWNGTAGHEVECIVENFEISADVGGKVEFTATLQFNGVPSAV